MFKPQDIGREGFEDNSPLFKVEFEKDGDKVSWVLVFAGAILAALFYALGATLPHPGLSGVAFGIAIVTLILFFFVRTKVNKAPKTQDEIDQQIERFKQDLVDTYNGYDIEYSAEDILDAADKYRSQIEEADAKNASSEIENASDVVQAVKDDVRVSRSRRAEEKKKRKDRKD